MSRLYGRDDVAGPLSLQSSVVQAVAGGFRPLRPALRGGAPSLPDVFVAIPPLEGGTSETKAGPGIPRLSDREPLQLDQDSSSDSEDASADLPAVESASAAPAAEWELVPQGRSTPPDVDLGEPEEFEFLFNPLTKIVHVARLARRIIRHASSGRARMLRGPCLSVPVARFGATWLLGLFLGFPRFPKGLGCASSMVAGKTQLWLLFWSPDSWGLRCCLGRFCQTWLHLCSTWHVALPCPLARTWSITTSCICGPSLLLRAIFCALNGRVAAPDFRALSRLVSLSHSGAEPGCERCSSVPPAATKSFRA